MCDYTFDAQDEEFLGTVFRSVVWPIMALAIINITILHIARKITRWAKWRKYLKNNLTEEDMAQVSWTKKLAGKIGMHPNNLYDVKKGIKHVSPKRAQKFDRLVGGGILIWLNTATDEDIARRGELIDKWVAKKEKK
jgi:DNA-binding transcriptional regulator YdaS (Cro superfamily)